MDDTKNKEEQLWAAYTDKDDWKARNALYEFYAPSIGRMVGWAMKRYPMYVSEDDIEAAFMLGLLTSITTFKRLGVSFGYYSARRMVGQLRDEIRSNTRVKGRIHAKMLLFAKAEKTLEEQHGAGNYTVDMIRKKLGWSEKKYHEYSHACQLEKAVLFGTIERKADYAITTHLDSSSRESLGQPDPKKMLELFNDYFRHITEPRVKLMLRLKLVEGLAYPDIAQAMGWSAIWCWKQCKEVLDEFKAKRKDVTFYDCPDELNMEHREICVRMFASECENDV